MILASLFVALLLALGNFLRSHFAIFDRIYLPGSVIAGGIGLALVQLTLHTQIASGPSVYVDHAVETLRGWPAILIAVVFAAMLLHRHVGSSKVAMRATGCEALMVYIIALGQTAIGLWLTWLVIQPFYDVPNSFGMLIETGFAGGHGTAAAMGQIFSTPQIAFHPGLDLGLLMATAGLVYGTVSGIFWINLAFHFGLAEPKPDGSAGAISKDPLVPRPPDQIAESAGHVTAAVHTTAVDRSKPVESGWARYGRQILLIVLAFMYGLLLRGLVGSVAEYWDGPVTTAETDPNQSPHAPVLAKLRWVSLVGAFPLFIYSLMGGWLIARLLVIAGRANWMDSRAGARISGWAMDVLVVAAIATLNLEAVATFLVPITLMFLGGAVWSAICLLVLSPKILPKAHWFELGLINYGMSTGTTATGFVLLRLVDPQLKTEAAKQYALAAPLSAPLVGGGLITIGLPLLVLERLAIGVSALVLSLIVGGLIVAAIRLGAVRK